MGRMKTENRDQNRKSRPGFCLIFLFALLLEAFLLVGCQSGSETAQMQEAAGDPSHRDGEYSGEDLTDEKEGSGEISGDGNTDITADESAADTADIEGEESGTAAEDSADSKRRLTFGDERTEEYLPLLEGKRVALFTNQTGIVGNRIGRYADEGQGKETLYPGIEDFENEMLQGKDLVHFGVNPDGSHVQYGEHILDLLVEKNVDVTAVFSPEHGFRGTADAGASVSDSVDEKTGVPILSLYSGDSHYPSDEDMSRFDTLVVDMQDVGLRYYTYHISLYYLMDACARKGKEILILDRPNPNGFYVDGPVLQKGFKSGVGQLPLPVVYGMTWGELARMINGEGWLTAGKDAANITVIECLGYTHQDKVPLVVAPSPNLKNMRAVYLYASTCFFENTVVSVGRGTEDPFTVFGSPYLKDAAGFDYSFTPQSMSGAENPPFLGQTCLGRDLRQISLEQIWDRQIDLTYLIDAYQAYEKTGRGDSFFGEPDEKGIYWLDKLCGTDSVRKMIAEGISADRIKASWQPEIEAFKEQRRPYLLYEE